ncbi:TPA: hypothetical protein ACRVQQ_004945 [Escherichia coli]
MNEVYVIAGGEWLRNNLTALGHILCVKTHDDILKKESQSD